MQTFRSSVLLLLFALLVVLPPQRAAGAAEIDPALVAAAKREGRLTFYSPLITDQIVRPLTAAFRSKYGIQVDALRMDSNQVILKILNEHRARRMVADVITTSLGIQGLITAQAIKPFKSVSASELPEQYKDPNGYWASVRLHVFGPAVNTNLVKPEDRPKTFDDLLDPKWAGKMVWRHSNMTGSTGFIANILATRGEQAGMEYLRRLARQRIISVSISDRALLDQVVAGEYTMAIAMTNHNIEISRKQGAPVAWIPLEPALMTSEQIGLTTLSPHPNAGLLFVEYALSREGQTVFQKAGYIPSHPAIPPLDPKLVPATGGFKANVFTPQTVEQNLKRWDDIADQLFR
jgi:ABC-type Fe3+ transport system substrate-binding protein